MGLDFPTSELDDMSALLYERWLEYDDRNTGTGYGLSRAARYEIELWRRHGHGLGGGKRRLQATGYALVIGFIGSTERAANEEFERNVLLDSRALSRVVDAWAEANPKKVDDVAGYYGDAPTPKDAWARQVVRKWVRDFEAHILQAFEAEADDSSPTRARFGYAIQRPRPGGRPSPSAEEMGKWLVENHQHRRPSEH